ncbi:Uncharacterized protein dnm_061770 [Desulfonema magnum]|uniref:Uncharacterized protein n=1 Tax=Desulfonema magnum TaxID=45655 RepID=A0A975GQJ9_9BACT|nr:Uncharacterized protein dnm_061770 [Desulfonema magnum]
MRDGCRTGFATPSETFAGGDPENIPDGVANPVLQKNLIIRRKETGCFPLTMKINAHEKAVFFAPGHKNIFR